MTTSLVHYRNSLEVFETNPKADVKCIKHDRIASGVSLEDAHVLSQNHNERFHPRALARRK